MLPLGLALADKKHPAVMSPAKASDLMDPWIEVDLQNIAHNLDQIRKIVHPRPVMAVIKANAYGHGLVETAKFLEKQNIRFLAVGKVQEALRLRKNEVKTPVLNFGPFSAKDAENLVKRGVSQSVFTDGIEDLAQAARKLNKKAKVHIKVDTGLGRVGIPYHQALKFIEKAASTPGITIEGIFTALTEDEEFDKIQLRRFLTICDEANKRGISVGLRHAASSAAILAFPEANLDIVRPGIAIYGHYPSTAEYRARKVDLKPAMSLKARVSLVKTLRPGESVSYHRKFTATEETTVATVSIGYSDGYPFPCAQKGEAIVRGSRYPLIAAVTSNHTTLDVTGRAEVRIGDEVVLMGKQGTAEVNAEEVAAWAGSSVYKIAIGMNPLLPRIYKS